MILYKQYIYIYMLHCINSIIKLYIFHIIIILIFYHLFYIINIIFNYKIICVISILFYVIRTILYWNFQIDILLLKY